MDVSNVRWSDDEFEREREKVLALWPTGKDVDLDEAIEYHKTLPDHKNFAKEVRRAKAAGLTFCQPRGGVALIDEHIKLLKTLQDEGGAELLPTTTDTYTRNMKFQEAQRGIEESRRTERSMLNGLPVVNHGPKEVRKVVEAVDRPIITLSGTCYPRLTAEITLAAGFTGFLGAGLAISTPPWPTSPNSAMSAEIKELANLFCFHIP
jgi:methylaspartate mutase epsilon subunit